MAKNKKKRAADGRLKVIAGGGGVRAVLPGKGPAWKQEQQARDATRAAQPSVGAHAASQPRSGPPNRRRADDDLATRADGDELSATKPIPAPFPRAIVFGGVALAIVIVAYFLLRNPPRGETPTLAPTPQTSAPGAAGSTLPLPPPPSKAAPNGVSAPPIEPTTASATATTAASTAATAGAIASATTNAVKSAPAPKPAASIAAPAASGTIAPTPAPDAIDAAP